MLPGMMVLSALRADASLPEFLAYRARSAPVLRLAAEGLIAVAALVAALRWNPSAQVVMVSASTCFFCYAGWGLLDRAAGQATSRGWRVAGKICRALSSVLVGVGFLAGGGVLFSIWALALGTWIS